MRGRAGTPWNRGYPMEQHVLIDAVYSALETHRAAMPAAELYLGFALSKLGHGVVAPAAVAGLLQMIYTIARGSSSHR